MGSRGGLVTPQQLVKGKIGALWMGWTAEELEDLMKSNDVTIRL